MTRQLTASLATDHALLSITVPVREETGDHLPNGSAWFAVGKPEYTVDDESISADDLLSEYGQRALDALFVRLWDDGTLTEEWDGLHD